MDSTVFSDETELKRLEVQGRLLREYEKPVHKKVIGNRKGLTLLDVGCNNGKKTMDCFSEENFSKIVGIDCLETLIAQAEEKYGSENKSFYVCDITAVDFLDRMKEIMRQENIAGFDVIHCSFVLMHLDEPSKVLKRLRELLAPNGCMIAIEPDDTESYLEPDAEGIFEQFLDVLDAEPYSGKRHLGGELSELLRKSGYSDVRLNCSGIHVTGDELSQKEDIFTTFCSYLPDDLLLLTRQEPENALYQKELEWVHENFEKLHRQITSKKTTVFMGVKIFTCGRA